jgi:nicotinamidase-related amidase
MRDDDALVLVDVLANFGHEDGDAMFASFRNAHERIQEAIAAARDARIPVVYANDDFGTWSGDRERVLAEARRRCPEPALIDAIAPEPDDPFICKPRYSAFDHTPLDLLLREHEVRRLLLAGTATEMCLAQSAIDGRELGYQITVLPEACAAVDAGNAEIALRYLAHVVGARIGLEAEAR